MSALSPLDRSQYLPQCLQGGAMTWLVSMRQHWKRNIYTVVPALCRRARSSMVLSWRLWLEICPMSSLLLENCSQHTEHSYGFSSAWRQTCLSKLFFVKYDFKHIEHWYGLPLLWMRRWLLGWPSWLNPLPHTAYLSGLSPLWRRCFFRISLHENCWPHITQRNDFLLLW